MSSSNIIIPSDLGSLIGERERIWAEGDKAATYVAELNQLSSKVPNCAAAVLQSAFSRENIPPTELASVLPVLKNELENIARLQHEIEGCHAEIQRIQSRDKKIIIAAIAAVVLFIIILIAVISS